MENIVINYVIYILIVVVFFIITMLYVTAFQDGAVALEDFYAKQIVKIIDLSAPGEEVYLDISKATKVALRRGQSFSNIFQFDNVNNVISVSLAPGRATSFPFFNDVDIVEWRIESPSPGAGPITNRLYFKIVEAKKNE